MAKNSVSTPPAVDRRQVLVRLSSRAYAALEASARMNRRSRGAEGAVLIEQALEQMAAAG